jgi:sortase B
VTEVKSERNNNGHRRKPSKARRRILVVLIIVCAAVFAVSAYMLIDYYREAHEAESAFEELRPPGDADVDAPGDPEKDASRYPERQAHYLELFERNEDFIGWLRIFGTKVNYPVMQTKDDRDYYLHRDFDKKYSAAGTLFASDISDVDRPSDVIIIFGHMMKSGAMFGGLKEYTSADYMREHQVMRFDTLEEERYYRIFSVFTESVGTGGADEFRYYSFSDFADEEEFNDFLEQAKPHELYDTGETAEYGDEIIALSTCEYTHADGRLVLLAKRFTP